MLFNRWCTLYAGNHIFLHDLLSARLALTWIYVYIYIVCVVYICVPYVIHDVSIVSINVASAATVAASLPSLLPLLLMHANNWWWTNKMASFGFGPGNPVRRYPRGYVGCLVMQFHSGMRDSQSIQFTHTPSRTFISMQEMKATASVCLLVEATNKSYIFLPLRWVGFYYIFGRLTHTHI